MKQLALTEARAKLSTLAAEVDKGKGPIAIVQCSKIKAVLVDAEWHARVEEELSDYRRLARLIWPIAIFTALFLCTMNRHDRRES